jgi:predicted  nucleic acid-binding Zn-ribbon protein
MKAEISNLVKLQARDDEIRALESRLAEIPKEVKELEREIATEKKNLKAAEDALAEGQKSQRAAEGELSAAEEKLSKYQDQLMNVKSNEEYKAMQKQIEVTKKEIGDIETKILQGLDTLEELEAKRDERDKELQQGQKKVGGMEKELDEEKKKLEAELAERQKAREELLSVIPEDLFAEYQKIAKARGGVAMAAAVDERCQVCMVRMRPQVFYELKLGDKHNCSSCTRILYYMEEETAATT